MQEQRLTPNEQETVDRLKRTPFNKFTREDNCALLDIIHRLTTDEAGPEPAKTTI